MNTLTITEITTLTVGDMPCFCLILTPGDGTRQAHVVPYGTLGARAAEYQTTDQDTLLDLVIYEPHMPGPLFPPDLTARLAQLDTVKQALTITPASPDLLDPLRADLAADLQRMAAV